LSNQVPNTLGPVRAGGASFAAYDSSTMRCTSMDSIFASMPALRSASSVSGVMASACGAVIGPCGSSTCSERAQISSTSLAVFGLAVT
jgi:hypothetical protein